ncbi:hypothetical protein ACFX2G_015324 [Malus domestica]|uniref:Ubiquitin-fold modifier-conjugating enzyme 1 n=1 Tax=Malus domestica TaxID=3750 RepID=A0A498I535_MALDO|nr:hypothetical protein DVH24_039980 [Malus domestica]
MVEKDGSAKGIVFSQFTSFLDISRFEYTQMNKSNDTDWFRISAANPEGTRWIGKCWYVYNLLKYEFDLQFNIPITYPATVPELELPQLDGKTQKMYRGGKICLTVHFKPLWAKNCPRFGMAHALCLGLAPWLAAFMLIRIAHGFSIYMKFMKRGLWLKLDASQYRKK